MHTDAEEIERAIQRILAIADPVELVAAATDALDALKAGNAALAHKRRAQLKFLSETDGLSVRKISAQLADRGTQLSYGRIQQILDGRPTGVGRPGRTRTAPEPEQAEEDRTQQAARVRELAATARSQAEIGTLIGVSPTRVGQIIAALEDADAVREQLQANRRRHAAQRRG